MQDITQPEIILIPGYKGGISNDSFAPLETQTFQKAEDLDLLNNQKILTTQLGLYDDTLNLANLSKLKLTNAYKASDSNIYCTGFDSTNGTTATLWSIGTLTNSSVATSKYTASLGAQGFSRPVEFQGTGATNGLFFFKDDGNTIVKYLLTGSGSDAVSGVKSQAPIFVHEGLGSMFYTTAGNAIGGTLTADTLTSTSLITFDNSQRITNMVPYNQYVAIGLQTKAGSKTSKIGIWDGSSTKLADLIEIPTTGLQGIANVAGKLVALCISNSAGIFNQNILSVYETYFGRTELTQRLDLKQTVLTTNPATLNPPLASNAGFNWPTITTRKNIVYFGFNALTASALGINNGVYAYDPEYHSLHLSNVITFPTISSVDAINFVDDYPVVAYHNASTYAFAHPNPTASHADFSGNGVYESNAFFLDKSGGQKQARIKSITINHLPLNTGQGFTLKHKSDQESNWITCNLTGYPNPSSKNSYTISRTESRSGTNQSFPLCRSEQLQLNLNLSSSLGSASIIFPIIVEVDTTQNIG